MWPPFHLLISVLPGPTYRTKHIARVLGSALSRSKTNGPQSESRYRYFSFCWVTVSSKSLRSRHVTYQHYKVTIRSSDSFCSRPNSMFFYVQFHRTAIAFFPFLIFSLLFRIYMTIRTSSTKLKKSNQSHEKNTLLTKGHPFLFIFRLFEFIKKCNIKH